MKIIYKANDGTEFTTHDKCQEYEMETVENKYKDFTSLTNRINAMFMDSHYETAGECFLINIKELNEIITADLKQVDKLGEFTAGETILVRNFKDEKWNDRVFIRYGVDKDFPYICEHSEYGKGAIWKYATKIINWHLIN
jgi:hypothetical protein